MSASGVRFLFVLDNGFNVDGGDIDEASEMV
jgi:hypothetical protein